ncbi:MAG TPA: hypothetical protein VFG76_07090 [Candidatus Polarisedimenticolia bacterium]|nr:hypothetical protein [Candidatus Polarisedimenticolia bacterium]
MTARKFAIGCSLAALVVAVAVVIIGVVGYRHLTAPVPIPRTAELVDGQTIGLAVVRVEPDNPWVIEMMKQLARRSATRSKDPDPRRILPLEVVWTAREAGPGAESQIVRLCLSPGGRLLALLSDIALWRAGREQNAKVTRTEYSGEGITSFSGSPLRGHVFVRDASLVWASDLDAARRAVDLISASPSEAQTDRPEAAALLSLMPQGEAGGNTLARAVMINKDGALGRSLTLLPGTTFDLDGASLQQVTSLTVVLGTRSGDEAAGEVTIRFADAAPAQEIQALVLDLQERIKTLATEKTSIEVTSRTEPGQAVLLVTVKGLEALAARLPHMVLDIEEVLKDIKDASEQPAGPATQPTAPN